MSYRLIQLSNQEAENADLCGLFDTKLRETLVDGTTVAALCLRGEMQTCIELVDWLVHWHKTFADNARRLIIVTAADTQYQYLELTHPDEQLVYVDSIETLIQKYPDFTSGQQSAPQQPVQSQQIQTPAPQSVNHEQPSTAPGTPLAPPPENAPAAPLAQAAPQALPQQQTPSPVSAPPAASMPQPAPMPPPQPALPVSPAAPAQQQPVEAPQGNPSDTILHGGDVSRVAGEYACCGCGATRMYAKGDVVQACANPECPKSAAGWKLVFELF